MAVTPLVEIYVFAEYTLTTQLMTVVMKHLEYLFSFGGFESDDLVTAVNLLWKGSFRDRVPALKEYILDFFGHPSTSHRHHLWEHEGMPKAFLKDWVKVAMPRLALYRDLAEKANRTANDNQITAAIQDDVPRAS